MDADKHRCLIEGFGVERCLPVFKYPGILSCFTPVLFGCLCLATNGQALAAESTASLSHSTLSEPVSVSSSRKQALRLIHEDTAKSSSIHAVPTLISPGRATPPPTNLAQAPEGALKLMELELTYKGSDGEGSDRLEETADGSLKMKPFVTGVVKIPDLTPPRETEIQKFIRTGTISEHVGKKITTRLWMKGDEGIMLRFSW